MAGVVVIPLAELVAWGVAGIAAMWMAKNPPKILPREAVALPPVMASESLQEHWGKELSKTISDTKVYLATTCKECPPCEPPGGYICIFVHMNRLSKPHPPCLDPTGGHIHTRVRTHIPPPSCECTWVKGKTVCFSAGADFMSILNKYPQKGCEKLKNANHY